MVWILEWSCPYDSETNATVWDTKENAYKQACSEVLSQIESSWDLNDPDYHAMATVINDLVVKGDYVTALGEWNNTDLNTDATYAQYWGVYERPISTSPGVLAPLNIPSLSSQDDEEEKEEQVHAHFDSSNGATCRGLCHTHNEYATPDKHDGTYVCHSCRMMSDFFGNPVS